MRVGVAPTVALTGWLAGRVGPGHRRGVPQQVWTVGQARRAATSWEMLQSRRWQRLGHGIYASSRQQATPLLHLAAAWERLPADAAFSGRTAAWLHGLDLPPCSPIDVTLPPGHPVAHRVGLRLHRARLEDAEVVVRQGYRVTSALRTLADLGAGRDSIEAVIALDMGLHAGLVSDTELASLVDGWAGRKGVKRLRRAVALAGVAESPMETRLRLLIVLAGLPAPIPQVELFDELGEFIARVDLYYPSHRLCIEFDGGQHRDQLTDDNRRQNRIVSAGYEVLRFTSADVLGAPLRVVATIRAALAGPPHPDLAPNPASPRHFIPDLAPNRARGAAVEAAWR